MPTTDPVTPAPRRFAFRLPRPLWVVVAAVVLIVATVREVQLRKHSLLS
jgi:hypothetical protein